MRQLPSGTVTLLFTDIEGSTRLLHELGERGEPERAGRLWGAIEDEDTGAPLGGWRRHRKTCEARIGEVAGPEFERARTEGRELTLEDAVMLALGT